MKLTLETERLILRPFTRDDAQAVFDGWASDPEVTKYMTWNAHKSIDETKYVLDMWLDEYEKPDCFRFAIESKENGRLIGGIDVVGYVENISLRRDRSAASADSINGSANASEDTANESLPIPVIGYDLSRDCWGRGYMTEACRCVLDCLFSRGYERVRIDADVENTGSNRVIQKCGGILLCTEEDYLPMKNITATVNRYIVEKK